MLISFWVKNRRSFLNALRWKGILFSKSPSNSIFNCLCYHTPHSFPQSFSWFQSTLPRGERRGRYSDYNSERHISIHAPTRGATAPCLDWCFLKYYFNPRSHEGSDVIRRRNRLSSGYFNPRSHEGSDGIVRDGIINRYNFNPRSHEGSDTRGWLDGRHRLWFQSTLPRGERRKGIGNPFWKRYISIHAPTRGATSVLPLSMVSDWYFNPRSHEGSDCNIDYFFLL